MAMEIQMANGTVLLGEKTTAVLHCARMFTERKLVATFLTFCPSVSVEFLNEGVKVQHKPKDTPAASNTHRSGFSTSSVTKFK